jgi:hypothetical protein
MRHVSVAQMAESFNRQIDEIAMPILQRYNKPAIFTEAGGCKNYDGGSIMPWIQPFEILPIDNQEQADYSEAAAMVASERPRITGFFWWAFINNAGPYYDDWVDFPTEDPRFKPAEQVISVWFR